MSLKVNAGVSALANILALVAAANPAFAAQNFQLDWLVIDNVQGIAANPTADANTTIDIAPETDTTKTGGVIVLGSKKTFTYGRADLAGFVDGKPTAATLDASTLTYAGGEYSFTDDAALLSTLLKDLFGLDALASEFTLSYAEGGNQHAADGGTSTVTVAVSPNALVFSPASAPLVITLTWPQAVSTDSATTTDLGAFTAE